MIRVLILMYHQVDLACSEREQRLCTPPREFRRQMAWVREAGYRPVGIDEVLAHVAGPVPIPGKAVHVTFDDGFVGVLEHALPVLAEYGMRATLFAVPGRVGSTNDWMWRRDFPRRALLSAEQLRLLADEGMTIGSHTRTHARLPEASAEEAETEIRVSKAELEDLMGREVVHFAYPYGLLDAAVREQVVCAGYRSACSTRSGFNRPGEDPFLLRRIDVFGTDRLWQFRQKLRYGTNEASRWKPLGYYAGRVAARFGRH
jgi:peptidoglycan/xylan/chitin deacetylase (PgdA/CDA1 family)